ncbi:hypothetical protein IE53DRAFT_254902 [Violaceomyces palustris]|uniref:Uncharacterized protein n=1 Tax=Violaceomyces palustris TaxID=1673888 RepID=A0ACD0NNF2_9BASI|nr:hypothetical protein IE53DRAFT_254902 [Violaceomyces palustris]
MRMIRVEGEGSFRPLEYVWVAWKGLVLGVSRAKRKGRASASSPLSFSLFLASKDLLLLQASGIAALTAPFSAKDKLDGTIRNPGVVKGQEDQESATRSVVKNPSMDLPDLMAKSEPENEGGGREGGRERRALLRRVLERVGRREGEMKPL